LQGILLIAYNKISKFMNPIIRNILAVVLGLVLGAAVNGGIISISSSVIPPPEGTDITTMEGLQAAMPLMQPKHFIMPFLAHAIGTFIGAFLAARLVLKNPLRPAMIIGAMFLLGGIMMVKQLPSPLWFNILDLVGAYIPMAWLAAYLNKKKIIVL
jgi:hypothetical protein